MNPAFYKLHSIAQPLFYLYPLLFRTRMGVCQLDPEMSVQIRDTIPETVFYREPSLGLHSKRWNPAVIL